MTRSGKPSGPTFRLAGMSLRVAIKVRGVREATDEEIEAGTLGGSPLSAALLALAAPPISVSGLISRSRVAVRS